MPADNECEFCTKLRPLIRDIRRRTKQFFCKRACLQCGLKLAKVPDIYLEEIPYIGKERR